MIEDALGTARTLHRLILSVSLLTVVFALSVQLPRDKVLQLGELEKLSAFPFKDYEGFVAEKVKAALPALTEARIESFNKSLEAPLIFDLAKIGEAARQPGHTGKIQTGNLIFTKIDEGTLGGLDAISSVVHVERPVQIGLPKVEEIQDKITAFLKNEAQAGARIANVKIQLGVEFDTFDAAPAETFLSEPTAMFSIYFEAVHPDSPPIPVFQAELPAELHEIPGTSWRDWFFAQKNAASLVRVDGSDWRWLPSIGERPQGFEQQKVGALIAELKKELRQSSPEEQKMNMLGSEIPGILVVYAAPLVLLSLGFYLLAHLRHLQTLLPEATAEFRKFAWLPLSPGPLGRQEALVTLLLLPPASLTILNWRLSAFQSGRGLALTVSLCATLLVALLGYRAIREVDKLRRKMFSAPLEENDPPP